MRRIGFVLLAAAIAIGAWCLPADAAPVAPPSAAPSLNDTLAALTAQPAVTDTDSSSATPARAGADGVSLGPRLAAGALAVTLPGQADLSVPVTGDGVSVYRHEARPFSVAVNPVVDGAQFVTVLADRAAPMTFDYSFVESSVGNAVSVVLTDDGGARLIDRRNRAVLAEIEAPWAFDARGRAVQTRFEVAGGGRLTQVVEHRADRDVAYPVTADPKVKLCDVGTAVCTKYSKAETKRITDKLFDSLRAGVTAMCSAIPGSSPWGLAAKGICAAGSTAYFLTLRGTFRKARKTGKCVELKIRIIGPQIMTGKVVTC